MTQALIAFAVMLALTFMRMPIAFAMGVVGIAGTALMKGWSPALAMATEVTYETGFNYLFSVVPLFILMGTFVSRAGMAEELYAACYAFIGHRRGGLAMATIGACGGFGAICGSSLATAATMSQVAMPSMRKFGYSPALGAGSIAAGGTLGILIPPSTVMVIYGIHCFLSSDWSASLVRQMWHICRRFRCRSLAYIQWPASLSSMRLTMAALTNFEASGAAALIRKPFLMGLPFMTTRRTTQPKPSPTCSV